MPSLLDRFVDPRTIVETAARGAGIRAARLDYDSQRKILWLSVAIKGGVQQHQLPIGKTFTLADVLRILFDGAPAPGETAADPQLAPTHTNSSPP